MFWETNQILSHETCKKSMKKHVENLKIHLQIDEHGTTGKSGEVRTSEAKEFKAHSKRDSVNYP